jgi:type VI secretion system protein VasJ
MLELKRPLEGWRWVACGKHPSARDYISIGTMFPLAASFSEWTEKGYRARTDRPSQLPGFCSWRFWAKGGTRNEIVCGVLRDSSDSIGRPYPLLIMGSGPLANWEDNWELAVRASEETWIQMESISSRTSIDIRNLEQLLFAMRPPLPQWDGLHSENAPVLESERDLAMSSQGETSLSDQLSSLADDESGYILLDSAGSKDDFGVVCHFNKLLKKVIIFPPTSMFIGGTYEASFLFFFKRPLNTGDFDALWSGKQQR